MERQPEGVLAVGPVRSTGEQARTLKAPQMRMHTNQSQRSTRRSRRKDLLEQRCWPGPRSQQERRRLLLKKPQKEPFSVSKWSRRGTGVLQRLSRRRAALLGGLSQALSESESGQQWDTRRLPYRDAMLRSKSAQLNSP